MVVVVAWDERNEIYFIKMMLRVLGGRGEWRLKTHDSDNIEIKGLLFIYNFAAAA
jgi:hypothetical protein